MKKILFTLGLLVSFGSFGQNKSTEDLIQSIDDIVTSTDFLTSSNVEFRGFL